MSRAWRCAAAVLLAVAGSALAQDSEKPAPRERRHHHVPSGAQVLAPLPQSMALGAVAQGGSASVYEMEEVLTLQRSSEEAQRADTLMRVAANGRLLRRRALPSLDLVLSTYRVAFGARLPEAIRQITDATPELLADLNHRYHLLAAPDDPRSQAYFARRIGWSPALAECARDRAVGLLDTPIARDHPALRRAAIRVFSTLPAGVVEAPADHGTAIAGLLVGDPAVPRFGGLIPHARLYAAAAFRADEDDDYASAEALAIGLDWLVAQQVGVINLSVGGPPNRVLMRALEETLARGIVIVAAAGNDGPDAAPAFPAALDPVIAVTAVDADSAIYADANRGTYIDFAAPGVDVWAPIASGDGRFHSGTSFAAPFVTALVAALGADAEAQISRSVLDLGTPGADPVFGRGLVRAATLKCGLNRSRGRDDISADAHPVTLRSER